MALMLGQPRMARHGARSAVRFEDRALRGDFEMRLVLGTPERCPERLEVSPQAVERRAELLDRFDGHRNADTAEESSEVE